MFNSTFGRARPENFPSKSCISILKVIGKTLVKSEAINQMFRWNLTRNRKHRHPVINQTTNSDLHYRYGNIKYRRITSSNKNQATPLQSYLILRLLVCFYTGKLFNVRHQRTLWMHNCHFSVEFLAQNYTGLLCKNCGSLWKVS